jgi:hypothetical protein
MKWKRDGQLGLRVRTLALALAALTGVWASSAKNAETSGNMATASATPLPVGTILPVTLKETLSLEKAQAGELVEAKVMQDVPLPNKGKIRRGAQVSGTILSVAPGKGPGVQLTLQLNKIEYDKEIVSIATSLRAIASSQAVVSAQMPFTGSEDGTPEGWANTVQIGGDIRFGDGGQVRNRQKQNVGKGVSGGVLVHIRENKQFGCEGPAIGDDGLQALWVFSSDACGVYGLRGVEIIHNGPTAPKGAMTLQFEKPEMKLDASTAMLLRVMAP